ncbi:MAG: hypothetical protein K2G69_05580 [Muribaculaceae bacterium]|nr:hypothetical protein [Muribaculaceae bacterium]
MTSNSNKILSVTWDRVIFHNNKGTQTGDLDLVNKNLYKQDGTKSTYTP